MLCKNSPLTRILNAQSSRKPADAHSGRTLPGRQHPRRRTGHQAARGGWRRVDNPCRGGMIFALTKIARVCLSFRPSTLGPRDRRPRPYRGPVGAVAPWGPFRKGVAASPIRAITRGRAQAGDLSDARSHPEQEMVVAEGVGHPGGAAARDASSHWRGRQAPGRGPAQDVGRW